MYLLHKHLHAHTPIFMTSSVGICLKFCITPLTQASICAQIFMTVSAGKRSFRTEALAGLQLTTNNGFHEEIRLSLPYAHFLFAASIGNIVSLSLHTTYAHTSVLGILFASFFLTWERPFIYTICTFYIQERG